MISKIIYYKLLSQYFFLLFINRTLEGLLFLDIFNSTLILNFYIESLDLENIKFGKEIFVGLELDESRTDQLFKIPLSFGKSLIDSKSHLFSSLSFFPKKKMNPKGLKFSNYSSNFSLQGKYIKPQQNNTTPWRIREWNDRSGFFSFFGYFFSFLYIKKRKKVTRRFEIEEKLKLKGNVN
jgi:hypothetical protein